jgi:hypothetical protein
MTHIMDLAFAFSREDLAVKKYVNNVITPIILKI